MTPPVGGKKRIGIVFIFALATLGGAMTTGIALYTVGGTIRLHPVPQLLSVAITVTAIIAYISAPLLSTKIPIVSGSWIIPRRWGAYGLVRYAALFGFNLGLGWRTKVASNLYWCFIMVLIALPSLGDVLVLSVIFASVRALPVAVTAIIRSTISDGYGPHTATTDARLFAGVAASDVVQRLSMLSAVSLGTSLVQLV